MMIYRERVLPSVANLLLPLVLFVSVVAVMLPLNDEAAIPVAIGATGIFVLIIFLAAPVIEVTETTLSCKGALIDRKYLGEVTVIGKLEIFETLGQNLDARAWLAIQASIKGLVKIEISDPADPTPYWLVSTRNPEKLLDVLQAN